MFKLKTIIVLVTLHFSFMASAVAQIEDSTDWAKDIYVKTLSAGQKIIRNHEDSALVADLVKNTPTCAIDDPHLMKCIEEKKAQQFTDAFYMIRSMKMGASFEAAKDGLSFTTAYELKEPNDNDYYKLMSIFQSRNEMLRNLYLAKVPEVMALWGLTPGMKQLKHLIETKFADSELKQKVLKAYDAYGKIERGKAAPLSQLTTIDGKEKLDFSRFKSRVVVVDVWATWCCVCLEKLPLYKALAEKYKNNDKVVFLTVSIDRQKAWDLMRTKVRDLGLNCTENFVADAEGGSSFETDYQINGIPRYLIIDADGNLISTFAPGAGHGLEEAVDRAVRLDPHTINDEGIQFLNLSFKEALERAKAENKKVFIDCYIQTCGPCKRMAAEIFPKKECGDWFNPRFISIVRDCQAGDGVDVQKAYNVGIYPTFLIVNPDGTLLCKEMGTITKRSKETFPHKMQVAMQIGEMEQEFWNGRRDTNFVAALVPLLYEHNSERINPLMTEFTKNMTVKQMCETGVWKLINQYTRPSHELFQIIKEKRSGFEKIMGKETIDKFLTKQ